MILKKIAVVGALLGTSLAYAFAPQTGTWIMTSEVNGKPGRGLAIDVQDNTLVMQMYAYDASGNATFYMTSGTLVNDRYSAPLNKYRGGRYLGSGDLSGKEDGSAGTVSMRFVSGTKGFITLPGEAELAPTQDGNGLVTTAEGTFGCEYQVKGTAAGAVVCAKVTVTGRLQYGYQFNYSVNDGEGYYVSPSSQVYLATMRRLTDRAGTGTGIVLKSETRDEAAAPAIDPNLLRLAIESVAAQAE